MLVAGGLGERLGYNGIKIDLPTETTTNTSYLQYYINLVLAAQHSALDAGHAAGTPTPFVIMTSDDTHLQTMAVLAKNDRFGLREDQVSSPRHQHSSAPH